MELASFLRMLPVCHRCTRVNDGQNTEAPKELANPSEAYMGTFWRLHHMTDSRVLKDIAAKGDVQT